MPWTVVARSPVIRVRRVTSQVGLGVIESITLLELALLSASALINVPHLSAHVQLRQILDVRAREGSRYNAVLSTENTALSNSILVFFSLNRRSGRMALTGQPGRTN
ncbi:hypothetical protein F4859DRAFT_468189 [Xylaria cf. heliscus]|nr:hypothetical protein F4859DRAFT_468189 [Xylaria cf. heliscus]